MRLIIGDALTELRNLPDESVHCCVTSPPYWGLRDYGVLGQIGLESSPDEYVVALVAVFREVRRVLRADGTLWLNIGDCYATGAGKVGTRPGGGDQGDRWNGYRGGHSVEQSGLAAARIKAMGPMTQPNRMPQPGLKPKDVVGIPWLVAFALRADGWWLRQDIIWSKPNPMPESVTDRCTKAHEYLFLLSKAEQYWFDAAAIGEQAEMKPQQRGLIAGKGNPARGDNGNPSTRSVRDSGVDGDGTRNKRSVWTVATAPFSEAHFATFPPSLIEPCIKAGCPEGGTVLDPFAGAGTTGLVADRLGRNAILIDLNPEYAAMGRRRIEDDLPLFNAQLFTEAR